jgi:hypothetical protein
MVFSLCDVGPAGRMHLGRSRPRILDIIAEANNVEFAYVPFYASWLNRIEAQFTALRYFALPAPTT